MARIVKEPFAPPRHLVRKRTSPLKWWQAFFAMIQLLAFKGQSS